MCGRYDYHPKEFADLRIRWNLDRDLPLFKPRYNIAPGQQAPVAANLDGVTACQLFQWGLVPSWAKDHSIGHTMINARAETLTEKPSFRPLLGKRHCLVLANGFYEWRREGKQKVPMRFKLKSGEPFAFAGLWDSWKKPDGNLLLTYTIITTEPNEVTRPIHNRMPVMLSDDDAMKWITSDGGGLTHSLSLLKPFPPELMESYEVSKLVNNPRNDSSACIQPVAPQGPGLLFAAGTKCLT